MATKSMLLAAASLSLLACAADARPKHVSAARPDPRDAEIQALRDQVQALAAKVDALSARADAAPPPPSPAPAPLPIAQTPPGPPAPMQYPTAGGATIVAGKPAIQSADGRFSANL